MIEVLRFIFEDFWHWLGVALLLWLVTLWTPFSVIVERKEEEKTKNEDNT